VIEYIIGDAVYPDWAARKVIAHVCNDLGAWGAGFSGAVSKRYKQPEIFYRRMKRKELGKTQFIDVGDMTWVANMIAQHGLRNKNNLIPLDYNALTSCLKDIRDFAFSHNASVHMPRIGCGLAGGEWNIIEELINMQICANGISVFVYDLPAMWGLYPDKKGQS